MKPSHSPTSPATLVRESLVRIHRAVKEGTAGPTLATLAAAAGVSGRTLQRHFIELLGKPPRDVIADVRLQRALLLVQTTSMPLADVAAAVGFGSQSRMSDAFRRTFGQSPGGFREQGETGVASAKTGTSKPNVSSSCVSRGRKTGSAGS